MIVPGFVERFLRPRALRIALDDLFYRGKHVRLGLRGKLRPRKRIEALGVKPLVGECERCERVEGTPRLGVGLGEAQDGAVVIRAGELRQQRLVGGAQVGPAARVIKRFGARDLSGQGRAGELFAQGGTKTGNLGAGGLGFIAQWEAVDHVEVVVGCGQRFFSSISGGCFVRLAAQQRERRLRPGAGIRVERRGRLIGPVHGEGGAREFLDRGIAHHARGIELAIALEFAQRGVIFARGAIGQRLPVQRIVGEQRIGGGLVQPRARRGIVSLRKIVVTQRQRGPAS